MSGFLGWLFGAKEQVAVEQEKAAPVVGEDDGPRTEDEGEGLLIPPMFVGVQDFRELVQRLAVVERRLDQDERSVTRLQARMEIVERKLEEWGGK